MPNISFNVMNFLKKIAPDAIAVVAFLILSFCYFMKPVSEGLVLGGHDNTAGVGLNNEINAYHDATGETSRWSNALFSGMPTYQLSPSYESSQLLGKVSAVYGLGTTGVLLYVFLYLLGFYILMRAFNFKVWLSALGAVVWAFSSYFFIIIAAGHIWKVMTLAFIPPTIAGLVLCYRGRLLWGGAVTALFTALQILSNHLQMTYYFLFVMLFIVLGFLADAIRTRTLSRFARATGVVIVAGLIGLCANLSNLYHTYEDSKETMRGKSELTQTGEKTGQSTGSGLERDYITQWSYGLGETWTLLVPDVDGGGTGSLMENAKATESDDFGTYQQCVAQTYQTLSQVDPQMAQATPGLNQYWGDQPYTVGPVYVGALVCLLFFVGLFYVKSPVKWGLVAATLLSLLFAWGHNSPAITDFFIDHLPMYNKFRTVSSALVMAEFTIPLLALLGLAEIVRRPELLREKPVYLYVSFALTGGVALLFALMPGLFFGDCLSAQEESVFAQLGAVFPPDFLATYKSSIAAIRHDILTASAWRSFFITALGLALLLAYRAGKLKAWLMGSLFLVICLVDMWGIDRRYLNDNNFTEPQQVTTAKKTPADEFILRDKDPDYRVLDLTHDTFNDNTAGAWHKNIGGYHAAKLRRYQDIIDRCLKGEIDDLYSAVAAAGGDMTRVAGDSIFPVLNLLNTKYFILSGRDGQALPLQNPYANGPAWFVDRLSYTHTADDEMAALHRIDLKREAVADAQFKNVLGETAVGATGRVKLTKYAPNELHYDVVSDKGGIVVFSEIYYPGWTATIDGRPAEIGRADYTLRALRVPAGSHKVVMEFRPTSITTTEAIAYTAIALILLGFVASLALLLRRKHLEGSANKN